MKLRLGDKMPLSVVFYRYDDGKNKTDRMIYCRIFIKGSKAEFSLFISCKEEEWDEQHKRFFPLSKNHNYLNYQLTDVETTLEEIFHDLKNKGFEPTPKMVRDVYKGKEIGSGKTKYSLFEFIDLFIAEIKLLPDEFGPETVSKYGNLKSHLKRFLQLRGLQDISMDLVRRGLIAEFESYLLTTPNEKLGRAMNRNSSNGLIIKLQAVTNKAFRMEVITRDPFDGFKLKGAKPDKVSLTEEELELMVEHTLGYNLALDRVRDIYLWSSFTGLRFTDALGLTDKNIFPGPDGNLWLTLVQEKTKEPMMIPLLKRAEVIYHKYKESRERTGFILPRISNQKVNSYLKIIAGMVGINKNISHKTARHSFAVLALDQGVPLKTISHWLGHLSIRTTEIYVQVTRKQLSDGAAILNKAFTRHERPQLIQELITASMKNMN